MSPQNDACVNLPGAETYDLTTEVGACLPVMSVVSQQLTDVSQIVESSVVSACSRFAPMTRQLQQLNLSTVRHEVDTLSQLTHEQTELNAHLQSMLSTQIERHICSRQMTCSTEARQALQELSTVHKLLAEAGGLAMEMQRLTGSVVAHVHCIIGLTDSLQGEIMGCVSDMQFQDVISQRLEHLVKVLQCVSQAVGERLAMPEPQQGDAPNPWLEMLAETYTMDGERQLHEQVGGNSSDKDQAHNSTALVEIELF